MANEGKLVIYNGMGKEETVQDLTTEQQQDITNARTWLDNKITEQKNNAKSGNKKLLDLGLTQAEATALTGYEPPEEE